MVAIFYQEAKHHLKNQKIPIYIMELSISTIAPTIKSFMQINSHLHAFKRLFDHAKCPNLQIASTV